ncbi:MAG: class I SAM-dependent methyltransferase [Candidatus Korarchaeota archaeon NZ13-K]|nr:MAG: class I SAM-dependent methyltransferase [Candidatus Korarchaeota archaeon NZ13-K]
MPRVRKCLNLGCGLDKRRSTDEEKWVNADIRPEVEPDVVMDMAETPYPFPDEEFDLVLLYDSLEHVPFGKIDDVIREIRRITKTGGKLVIKCPDLEAIALKYILNYYRNGDYRLLSYIIYGAQDYEHNFHKSGFTMKAMRNLLESHGFRVDSMRIVQETNMLVEATKV